MIMRRSGIMAMVLVFAAGSCWPMKCPLRSESVVLDLDEFQGNWYLVAASPTVGNVATNCSGMTVILEGLDRFKTYFTSLNPENGEVRSYVIDGGDDRDVVGSCRLAGSDRTWGPFHHRVIIAAYEDFLAMVVCPVNEQDPNLKIFGVVLSRSHTLSPETLKEAKDKISPYVGAENIYNLYHDHCPTGWV